MKYIRKAAAIILSTVLCTGLLGGCGTGSGNNGKTSIEVFVFKPESVETFQKLGKKFEQENPDIKVYINSPGDAYAILKARMVKGNEPDIVGLDATQTYVDYANTEIFEDLTDSDLIKKVKPSYVEMLATMENMNGKVHAMPFAIT